jgi:hypothetical protein
MRGTTMTRWLNVEKAKDEHGNSYVRILRNPDIGALATVEAFDPNPDGTGPQWAFALYSITPEADPDAERVVIEWHGPRDAWYVGAIGYRRMTDAALAALGIARARQGRIIEP